MAILYLTDGTRQEIVKPDGFSLTELHELVGGYIEMITLGFTTTGERLAFIIDEEGKLKEKQVNTFATALWHSRFTAPVNDVIVGDALLVTIEHEGQDDEKVS